MKSSRGHRADRRRMDSIRMHERLAAASRRKADGRDRSLTMAAKCRAAIRPSPFFAKLPTEIRVMIYNYAYGREAGTINVKLKREVSASGKASTCALDPLIAISKQWYYEAFDSFVRSKQLHFEDFNDLWKLSSRLPHLKKNITSVSWSQNNIFAFPYTVQSVNTSAPDLESLSVFIGCGRILTIPQDFTVQYPCHFTDLREIRGLKSFHATFEDFAINYPELESVARRAFFKANGNKFIRDIHDEVTKAKGT